MIWFTLLLIWPGLAVFLVYITVLSIHRLWLSPISHFPGPKFAALTFWYEFFFDVYKNGRYTWKIKELHRQYGPIIRINPEEIHIDDPSFYGQIYVGSGRRTEKWTWSAKMFGTTTAAVGTTDHHLHRIRRGALNPYFSKSSVGRLQKTIRSNVDLLHSRLQSYQGTGRPVNLSDAFTCLSADVIGSYAFGKSYGLLDSEDFIPRWRALMMDLSRGTHLMKQFGWLYNLATHVPEWVVAVVHPLSRDLFKLRRDISNQIDEIKRNGVINREEKISETVFHGILNSNLPPSEKSTSRLTDEGLTIIGAGTVTTAHTLAVIFYHLLSKHKCLKGMQQELSILHETSTKPTWAQLSNLPYLSAIINEGLRLSLGVSHRLQRVSPDTALHYKHWTIPPGTPASQTQMFILTNPEIFPNPDEFIPERWLEPGDRISNMELPHPSESKKYLVPFSRGSRSCLGINLAYAELYLTVGTILRPKALGGLDMQLFETGPEEMVVEHDFFNPSPKLGSRGVRVLID